MEIWLEERENRHPTLILQEGEKWSFKWSGGQLSLLQEGEEGEVCFSLILDTERTLRLCEANPSLLSLRMGEREIEEEEEVIWLEEMELVIEEFSFTFLFKEEQKEEESGEEKGRESLEIAPPSSRWILQILSGMHSAAFFSLEEGRSYLLGSCLSEVDIVLSDRTVSAIHAELRVTREGELFISDRGSLNGTYVREQRIEGERALVVGDTISLGDTLLILVDQKEGEKTLPLESIPLLHNRASPNLKEGSQEEENESTFKEEREEDSIEEQSERKEVSRSTLSSWVALALSLFGLSFVIMIGMGMRALFQNDPVPLEQVDYEQKIRRELEEFPTVRADFDRDLGVLFLQGHLSHSLDNNRLVQKLSKLSFVDRINNHIILDEGVVLELNQVLARKGKWLGVEMVSTEPGLFLLTGNLRSKQEVEELDDYVKLNFKYLFENQVVAIDDLLGRVRRLLQESVLIQVKADYIDGQIVLGGNMGAQQTSVLNRIIQQLHRMEGIRHVKNNVSILSNRGEGENTMVDLTDRYVISGFTQRGGVVSNVVIRGKVLSEGGIIDGMKILSIKPDLVILEREGIKYKIRYNSKR